MLRAVEKPAKKLLDLTEGVQAWDYDDEAPVEPAVGKQPEPVASSVSGRAMLYDRQDKPIVDGKQKNTLTNAQYDVVHTLLNTGDKGLTKDALDRESKRGDARKILNRLADSEPAVAFLPGKVSELWERLVDPLR